RAIRDRSREERRARPALRERLGEPVERRVRAAEPAQRREDLVRLPDVPVLAAEPLDRVIEILEPALQAEVPEHVVTRQFEDERLPLERRLAELPHRARVVALRRERRAPREDLARQLLEPPVLGRDPPVPLLRQRLEARERGDVRLERRAPLEHE